MHYAGTAETLINQKYYYTLIKMSKKQRLDVEKIAPTGGLPPEEVKKLVEEMKVGAPIPVSQVPMRKRAGRTLDHWLALCKELPKGYAQEVKGFSPSGARSAINRLIKLGLLPNEYIVRLRGKKGVQRIFILHV
jgi:hypothetical protein